MPHDRHSRFLHRRVGRGLLRPAPAPGVALALAALLSASGAQAQRMDYVFDDRDETPAEHYFPTTTGKYHIIDLVHSATTGDSEPRGIDPAREGWHVVELEALATGYWPGQTGFSYGVAGYPLAYTSFHEFGRYEDEWAFRGRDGAAYGESIALAFGSALRDIGDRIRLELNPQTGALNVYTKRAGDLEFTREAGKSLPFDIFPEDGRELRFAVAGICWQPCGVAIIESSFPADSDATLTAAGGVSEPVALSVSADSQAEAMALFDFSLADGAADGEGGAPGDNRGLDVSALTLHIGGTLDPTRLAFRLDGPGVSDAIGSYDAAADTLSFSELDISVPEGGSSTYTLSAWFTSLDGVANGQTLTLSIDGDTDLSLGAESTLMAATTPVTNGAGSVVSGINGAPSASGVGVTGNLQEGEILTGTYTFSDADDDDDSSALAWLRADDASGANASSIDGATGSTYTLATADIGHYIRFHVTPHDGISAGAAVASAWAGPVLTANQPPLLGTAFDSQHATQGTAFTLDAAGHFIDPDGDDLEFSAAGLPDGLAISAASLISGIPGAAALAGSPYTVTLNATDPDGAKATAAFSLTVSAPSGEPPASTPKPGLVVRDEARESELRGNIVISPSGVVDGGLLDGMVQNDGLIIGTVILGGGTRVRGGVIAGDLRGDSTRPALVEDAIIAAGARLENVTVGWGTILDPGVEIGPNVRFRSASSIPPGLDLGPALESLQWRDGDDRRVPDLTQDLPLTGGDAPLSLIRAIQLLDDFEPAGNSVTQDPGNGRLLIVTGDSLGTVLPAKVSLADEDQEEGTWINEDGDVVFVTANRRVVVAHATLVDSGAFETLMNALGLTVAYDGRAGLMVSGAGAEASSTASDGGAVQALNLDFRYSGRPDVSALPAPAGLEEGLHSRPVDGLPGVHELSMVFRDADGRLMEQAIVPTPADWTALKHTLRSLSAVTSVRIGAQGVITVERGGVVVRGRTDYVVLHGEPEPEAAPGQATLHYAEDFNGDGKRDYLIVFPNGNTQRLYVYPR